MTNVRGRGSDQRSDRSLLVLPKPSLTDCVAGDGGGRWLEVSSRGWKEKFKKPLFSKIQCAEWG